MSPYDDRNKAAGLVADFSETRAGGSFEASRSAADPSTQAGTTFYEVAGKRIFDLVVAVAALVLLAPLWLLLVVLLGLTDGFPVLYGHRRIGFKGRSFSCLKFRSMVKDSDVRLERLLGECSRSRREWEETQKLRHDPRVHGLGKILRRSSLDEIPQLLNVIRGDMSIVGPRPIVRAEAARYGSAFETYLSVRPGLTGLWQVSGRSEVGYGQRVALDVAYVRSVSFRSDVSILMKTVRVVILGHGSC